MPVKIATLGTNKPLISFSQFSAFSRNFDLSVMSSCNHSIYDYGTFGFWGAFLADGFAVTAQNLGEWSETDVVKNQIAAIHNVAKANLDRWIWIDVEKLKNDSKANS